MWKTNGKCSAEVEEGLTFLFSFLKKKKLTGKDLKSFLEYLYNLIAADYILLDKKRYYPENIDISKFDRLFFKISEKQTSSVFQYLSMSAYVYKFKHPSGFKNVVILRNKKFTKKEINFLKTLFSFWDFINFERKQKEKLKKYVYVDSLTGLYNRYFLENVIPRELKKVERYNQTLSVLFIDIDDFKYINDIYGHSVGDEVLKLIGKIFKENIRSSDIPIRYGGDEFIIFLPFTKGEFALKLAYKLKDIIKNKIENKLGIKITISVGVLEVEKQDSLKELLDKLDELLYSAKSSGKDKIISQQELV